VNDRATSARTSPARAGLRRGPLSTDVPIILYADEWIGVGGTAGYVVMLGRGLRRRGYRVAAICHATDGVAPMRASLAEVGVDVRPIESAGGRLDRQRAYRKLMREYRGGVLALLMGYFTRAGAVSVAGTLAGIGAIVRAELTPPEPPITRKQRIGLRVKDVITDRFVVGAGDNREAFAREIGIARSKIEIIHTGIELERFQPGAGRAELRARWGIDDHTIVVATHSRLADERKGVAYFLDMAAKVAPRDPRVLFVVSGDGVLRPGLEAQAERLGIADRVRFVGWQSDAAKVFAAIDIFVMPSTFEGGPTTVLEAMAMTRPVIASHVGMVPEVIADGISGLIVPPADPAALGSALTRLLADEPLRTRLGERAREHALANFSIEHMVEAYLRVFADALARPAPLRRLARAIP
jgi:glycosyltransferase involved in cell wall biosynthesis